MAKYIEIESGEVKDDKLIIKIKAANGKKAYSKEIAHAGAMAEFKGPGVYLPKWHIDADNNIYDIIGLEPSTGTPGADSNPDAGNRSSYKNYSKSSNAGSSNAHAVFSAASRIVAALITQGSVEGKNIVSSVSKLSVKLLAELKSLSKPAAPPAQPPLPTTPEPEQEEVPF